MASRPESPSPHNYAALCSDVYVNQRLNLKMDLPTGRETVLNMFDRVRREFPAMTRFRRLTSALALESDVRTGNGSGGGAGGGGQGEQQWVELRKTSIRSGTVNQPDAKGTYALHKLVLDIAPFFLSISPLDIDYLELLFGFDLLCAANHDAIVYDTLIAGSPMAKLLETGTRRKPDPFEAGIPVDCQPLLGVTLSESGDLQAHFEIKTRTPPRAVKSGEFDPAPLSVYLVLRRYGAVDDVSDLAQQLQSLIHKGEEMLEHRVIPHLLMPLREAVSAAGGEFPHPRDPRD